MQEIRKRRNRKNTIKTIVGGILLLALLIIIASEFFLVYNFGDLEFSIVLYQIRTPLKGTGAGILSAYIRNCLVIPIIFMAICWGISWIFRNLKIELHVRVANHRRNIRISYIGSKVFHYGKSVFAIGCTAVVVYMAQKIGVIDYIKEISDSTQIYEDYYVNPNSVSITFPEQKKNLIFIYMESMEATYASVSEGGGKPYNYIPNLYKLAEDNVSFSNTDTFGGHSVYDGWTFGGLVSSTSGINYMLPIQGNDSEQYSEVLPGVTSLGSILEKAGYHNVFMCGSDASFGGRDIYFEEHGNYEIKDYYTAIDDEIITDNYKVFWGFEDEKLYQYAKKELEELSQVDQPFNFTMLTVDTHHPEGYVCELCENNYEEQYANVIQCADRQVKEFIDWIQAQEWFENTAIVIVGDHRSMNTTFWEDIPEDYQRVVYNCFINPFISDQSFNTKNRNMLAYDLFPTTLAALGANIEGERLGLGTNVFSTRQTLAEELGTEQLKSELAKYSNYYVKNFINGQMMEEVEGD